MVGSGLFAQALPAPTAEKSRPTAPGIVLPPVPAVAGTFFYGKFGKPFSDLYLLSNNLLIPPTSSPAGMGTRFPAWEPESLPFFCRVEHHWSKRLSFAFKFRLGSVEYVDWLEGKSDWPGR